MSGQEALLLLEEGNARFAAGRPRGCRYTPEERALLAGSQSPVAAVLACSDSRVPPELVFDRTLGELFVIRLAGHVPGRLALASINFAVEQLRVPLVVVLGHQNCAAVEAAWKAVHSRSGATPAAIAPLFELIGPGLEPLASREIPAGQAGQAGSLLDQAIEAHVRNTVDVLASVPLIRDEASQGSLLLKGAVYRLDTGEVDWLG